MPANPLGVLLRNRRAGHGTLAWSRSDLADPDRPGSDNSGPVRSGSGPEPFALTSPAFEQGAPIPDRHRGHVRGPNISPALAWTPPSPETKELVLIVQDPDVPMKRPATHALTIGIDPALGGLPENGLRDPSPVPGLSHGKGAFGRRGYSGPLPPRSHGPHTYVFQLYAIDRPVDLPAGFTLQQLLDAIAGHVVARARLDGTYEIR